jgi:long-chain acyl-CoA synthetase
MLAAGLASIGIAAGERVGLMGSNRPEWVVADYALQHLGAVVVPIYASSPPDQIADVLTRIGAKVCLADSDELMGRIREASVPGLRTVVALHRGDEQHAGLIGRGAVERAGQTWLESNPDELDNRLANLDSDHVATVIFTSGTGGDAKGVALSHRNLIWAAEMGSRAVGVRTREKTLSYLPLAHAFERVLTAVIPVVAPTQQWTVWFVDEIGRLPAAIRSVRPTIFVAVPSVWERMQTRIETELRNRGVAGGLARLALAGRRSQSQQTGKRPARRLQDGLARLTGRRMRRKIGLDRCWFAVSGAASLRAHTQRFFQTIGVPLHQGWGLTETAALCTVQRPDDLEVGIVGAPLHGVEIQLSIDGEVLVRGPNVFLGYEGGRVEVDAFDQGGFFHTGDVGRLADGGRLQIIDRVKDVIITAGGRKVAPRPIEDQLGSEPVIAEAMVLGEGRPFLVALISLEGTVAADLVGGSTNVEAGLWEHPKVRQRVERAVAVVNRSLPPSDQIHRFAILPFGFPDEALTPTLKLKRRVVEQKFSDEIEALYA